MYSIYYLESYLMTIVQQTDKITFVQSCLRHTLLHWGHASCELKAKKQKLFAQCLNDDSVPLEHSGIQTWKTDLTTCQPKERDIVMVVTHGGN